jgi:hypothetical protein
MFKRIHNTLISFFSFYKDFGDEIQSIEGALLENQVMHHYTLPFKSNLNGMGCMPFHHTLVVVKGNTTMPLS